MAAAAGAAVKVGAAVLAAVPGVAGLGSRQGGRGAATGAGSQACTVESYIFVTWFARLCSCKKIPTLFPYIRFLKIQKKAVVFLASFPKYSIGKP